MEETRFEETDNRSEKSNEGIASVSVYSLLQVFENLVLLGLCSLEKWDFALMKMKIHPDIVCNGDLFSLYLVLNQVFQNLSSKIYQTVDSQDKLPLVHKNEMSFSDIMQTANPILKKKTWKDRNFSGDVMNSMLTIVREVLLKHVEKEPGDDNKRKSRKTESKNKKQKSCEREPSPCPSNASSSSQSSSSSESSASSSSSSSSSSSDDEYEKIFKSKTTKSNKSPLIRQIFQTRKHNLRKKMMTPGEKGRYMIKIEISDVRDLKKCKTPKTYWTQVSKKALFVINPKDDVFKKVDDLMITVGQKISKIQGTEVERFKFDKNNKFN